MKIESQTYLPPAINQRSQLYFWHLEDNPLKCSQWHHTSTMKLTQGLERKTMFSAEHSRFRRKSFEAMSYVGDWHTPLHRWLSVAEADVLCPETRQLIKGLIAQLNEKDECSHEVHETIETPYGFQPDLIVDVLSEGMLHDSLDCLIDGREIHITATVRGSREHAVSYVNDEIKTAISRAKIRLRACK